MTVLFSRLPLQLPPGLIRSADSIVILTYWLAVDDPRVLYEPMAHGSCQKPMKPQKAAYINDHAPIDRSPGSQAITGVWGRATKE
jgi:hypothetical protein